MAAAQLAPVVAPHVPALLMIPLIGLSILLIFIAIIVLAAGKTSGSRIAGGGLMGLGLLIMAGAGTFAFYSERRASKVGGALSDYYQPVREHNF